VIKASDYAVGTNLTHAFPGVTLEFATHPYGYGPGFLISPLIVSKAVGQYDPITFNSFGPATGGDAGPFPADDVWYALYVVFAGVGHSLEVTTYSDSGDLSFIANVDAAGNPINPQPESGGSCLDYVAEYGQCLLFSQTLIGSGGSLLVGSSSSSAYVTEIDMQVPEPSSIALFGIGLLAIGFTLISRRRPNPNGRS